MNTVDEFIKPNLTKRFYCPKKKKKKKETFLPRKRKFFELINRTNFVRFDVAEKYSEKFDYSAGSGLEEGREMVGAIHESNEKSTRREGG